MRESEAAGAAAHQERLDARMKALDELVERLDRKKTSTAGTATAPTTDSSSDAKSTPQEAKALKLDTDTTKSTVDTSTLTCRLEQPKMPEDMRNSLSVRSGALPTHRDGCAPSASMVVVGLCQGSCISGAKASRLDDSVSGRLREEALVRSGASPMHREMPCPIWVFVWRTIGARKAAVGRAEEEARQKASLQGRAGSKVGTGTGQPRAKVAEGHGHAWHRCTAKRLHSSKGKPPRFLERRSSPPAASSISSTANGRLRRQPIALVSALAGSSSSFHGSAVRGSSAIGASSVVRGAECVEILRPTALVSWRWARCDADDLAGTPQAMGRESAYGIRGPSTHNRYRSR
ncbi:MAG: hypothetical protein Q9226_001366 [Calogaya cf. arnoldii]